LSKRFSKRNKLCIKPLTSNIVMFRGTPCITLIYLNSKVKFTAGAPAPILDQKSLTRDWVNSTLQYSHFLTIVFNVI